MTKAGAWKPTLLVLVTHAVIETMFFAGLWVLREHRRIRFDPMLATLSGVSAYGMDQAYLRFLERGTEYQPDVVLIGYRSENLARHANASDHTFVSSTD